MPVKIIVTRYKCSCHGTLFKTKKEAEACEREYKKRKAPISKKEMADGLGALFG